MSVKLLTEDFANKVYDILVKEAGAREEERKDFIYVHCIDKFGCQEWRCGINRSTFVVLVLTVANIKRLLN